MRPAGSKSVTSTPVALSGPLFVTVTVKVIVSPTFGVASLTVFVMERPACWGVIVADDVLLPVFGSNWSACDIFAMFVCVADKTTTAWSSRDAVEAFVTVPTAQTPVVEL
nr:hypothetical protein [Paenibacillus albiflavus]